MSPNQTIVVKMIHKSQSASTETCFIKEMETIQVKEDSQIAGLT